MSCGRPDAQARFHDGQPILAQARASKGAAIDPVGAYRKERLSCEVRRDAAGQQSLGGGIV
jgi:L-rhamnose isomerase